LNQESKNTIIDNTITIYSAMRQSLNTHNKLCKDHYQLRDNYLQKKVEEYNARDDTTEVMNIEKLIRRERRRQDHAFIRKIIKNKRSKGLTVLEIPCPISPGRYIRTTDPIEIQKYLLTRNINHFGQANNTPRCQSPIIDCFHYDGINAATKQLILEGKIPLEIQNLSPHIDKLLDQLASGNNLPTIQTDILYEDFYKGMVKWNERTTTSPSGRHLGHYKVLTRLQIMNDDNTINISNLILNLYYTVCMTAANTGCSLYRWRKISTCMIEKIPGVPRIDTLRVIHLFEADFNILLKLMWARKGVWYMHDKHANNDGQAGSRPGKRAIDVVIQKEMKYLYAVTTRTPLGTIDNDAKSCYDRMICNLSTLISYY
jgi:hypothetical protein